MEPPAATRRFSAEADTLAFAQDLATRDGLRNALIELQGDLGAGKTTLVRHLLRALGVTGPIKSPTYAVVEPHQAAGIARADGTLQGPAFPVWHFDFYRFLDSREWEDAGLRELFAAPGLKLVEWPEQAHGVLPPPDLRIALEVLPDEARAVRLQAFSPLGEALLA